MTDGSKLIRIASLNVNGLRNLEKFVKLYHWVMSVAGLGIYRLLKASSWQCTPIIEKIFDRAGADPAFQEQLMQPTNGNEPIPGLFGTLPSNSIASPHCLLREAFYQQCAPVIKRASVYGTPPAYIHCSTLYTAAYRA